MMAERLLQAFLWLIHGFMIVIVLVAVGVVVLAIAVGLIAAGWLFGSLIVLAVPALILLGKFAQPWFERGQSFEGDEPSRIDVPL